MFRPEDEAMVAPAESVREERHTFVRSGLTLMETLIAIFVVSVGLLGLATLIPVGRHQMETASRIDRAATLGRSAFRNLGAYGHLGMSKWAYVQGGGSALSVIGPNGSFNLAPAADTQQGELMTPPNAPLVLDPLMIAYNFANPAVVRTFPYELPGTEKNSLEWSGAPSLARVTLVNPIPAVASPGGATPPPLMTLSTADSYFRGGDDRIFNRTENPEVKPIAIFTQLRKGGVGAATDIPAATQAQGDYSWFAVLTPSRFEVESPSVRAALTRQFEATIVVCHKRPLGSLSGTTYENRDRMRGERRAHLEFLSTGTFRQGSVDAVMTMSDLRSPAEADQATYLRNGEWIMVMAFTPTVPKAISSGTPPLHTEVQFFNVLSVGRRVVPTPTNPQVFQRRIRLGGNNWTVPDESNANAKPKAGYAVLIDGAVAVYRKTLVFDGQSMWSP